MILRYIFSSNNISDLFEARGPFRGFGAGHRHGHRHDHEHGEHGMRDEQDTKSFAAFGPFGGGRGRRGGFGGGRKIGSGDLQVVILSMLAEKPSYGYEIIKALEEKSGGFYVPSPGMIYPALTYVEELGYATVEFEGARKRYSITGEGKAHLELNRVGLDAIMAGFAKIGARMDDVRRAMDGDDEEAGLHRDFHSVRHALRAALHAKRRSGPAEAKRIVGILERAVAEILAGPPTDA